MLELSTVAVFGAGGKIGRHVLRVLEIAEDGVGRAVHGVLKTLDGPAESLRLALPRPGHAVAKIAPGWHGPFVLFPSFRSPPPKRSLSHT